MCDVCRRKAPRLTNLQCLQHSACDTCMEHISLRGVNLVTGVTCPVCKAHQKQNAGVDTAAAPQRKASFDWLNLSKASPPPPEDTERTRKYDDPDEDLTGNNEEIDAILRTCSINKPRTRMVKYEHHQKDPQRKFKDHTVEVENKTNKKRVIGQFLSDDVKTKNIGEVKGEVKVLKDKKEYSKEKNPTSTSKTSDDGEWDFDEQDFPNLWTVNRPKPKIASQKVRFDTKLPSKALAYQFIPGFGPGSESQVEADFCGEKVYLPVDQDKDSDTSSTGSGIALNNNNTFSSFFEIDPTSGKEVKFAIFGDKKICLSPSVSNLRGSLDSDASVSERAEYGSEFDKLSVGATNENFVNDSSDYTEPDKGMGQSALDDKASCQSENVYTEKKQEYAYMKNNFMKDNDENHDDHDDAGDDADDDADDDDDDDVLNEYDAKFKIADSEEQDSDEEDFIQIIREEERGTSPCKGVNPNFKLQYELAEPPKRRSPSTGSGSDDDLAVEGPTSTPSDSLDLFLKDMGSIDNTVDDFWDI